MLKTYENKIPINIVMVIVPNLSFVFDPNPYAKQKLPSTIGSLNNNELELERFVSQVLVTVSHMSMTIRPVIIK